MKLLNLVQLYKIIKSGNSGDLKEYSKSMSPTEVKDLRVNRPIIFKVIRWILAFIVRNKKHNLANTVPTPSKYLARDEYRSKLIEFNKTVIETIPSWNALSLDGIDNKYFVVLIRKADGRFDGFEDALQWSCYLATSIKRVYRVTKDASLLTHYNKLISGISSCIEAKDYYAIKRHPISTIKKDLEPISQDMISGLVLLISEFDKDATNPIEVGIKLNFNSVMLHHDYRLMYPDGRTDSYDLAPNLIYNHIKSFAYSSIRMSQGMFSKNDAKVLKAMLQMLIPEAKPPYSRSWYGLVVAVNLLDAMMGLYPNNSKQVDSVMSKQDFLHLALDFLRNQQASTPEIHPELESVLHRCYDLLGHKDGKKETSSRLLSVLNLYPMFNLVEKHNGNHAMVDGYDGTYALTPHFRRPADYYWQRSAWSTGSSDETHPSYEFSTAFARVLPFNYYPEDTNA